VRHRELHRRPRVHYHGALFLQAQNFRRLDSGEPSREIEGPMVVVILGGLVTSTVLNLLVLPTLALRYGRFDMVRED
jgi:hypothetical protein